MLPRKSFFLDPSGVSEAYWTSLLYFSFYRFLLATLLLVAVLFVPQLLDFVGPVRLPLFSKVVICYWLASLGAMLVRRAYRHRFNLQLSLQVAVDILVLVLLMHASGGLRSGLGVMLLISLAAAGLVGQGRLVLFYAAVATIALLVQQILFSLRTSSFVAGDFLQAGLLSAGFFASAISARLLASRVVANEELAYRRGVELLNQVRLSQRIIEDMQDGVLVVDAQGKVRQHNVRAEHLLGLPPSFAGPLAAYSLDLNDACRDWRAGVGEGLSLLNAGNAGKLLQARFVHTVELDGGRGDALIFLEDMDRLREQAQQLKLAALGRLTANIAHEIRNPLSAINHAAELLHEGLEDGAGSNPRLLRIVLDNTQRLERIVRDVLEVGRRDRVSPESIDVTGFLTNFVAEFAGKEMIPTGRIVLQSEQGLWLRFDRSHLHQVLWNLLGNAVRHGQSNGQIEVQAQCAGDKVAIHVRDDGPGIDGPLREQVFEPFFTTHHQGTGLGLYIARELCESNGARLVLLNTPSGTDFCLIGGLGVSESK